MRSKTRLIAAVASLLVCLAMVGTGFASWVILQSKEEVTTGNVTAEAIQDGELTFSVTPDTYDIIYGSPESMDLSNAWLVEGEAEAQGELEINFVITIQGNVKSLEWQYKLNDPGSKWSKLKDGGLIVDPTYSISSISGDTNLVTGEAAEGQTKIEFIDNHNGNYAFQFTPYNEGKVSNYNFTKSTTISLKVTFGWGAKFGNENPYNYFNKDKSVNGEADSATWTSSTPGVPTKGSGADGKLTWGDVAKGVLDNMHTQLTDVSYSFTFKAQQAA